MALDESCCYGFAPDSPLSSVTLFILADADDRIIAVTNGWVDPILKYMHCEALQVFTRGLKGEEGGRLRGGPRGLGLYVGVATFAFAHSKGCKRAEILAINDDGVLFYARVLLCCQTFK
jgi:hypothetical protein